MNAADPAWMWGVALIACAFGIVIGIVISYFLLTQNKRASRLQAQLDAAKSEFSHYRAEVNEHFRTTSELFQDMTRQYQSVYEHLAKGAQQLCDEEVDALRLDIPGRRVLPREAPDDAAMTARPQTDAPERLADTGHDEAGDELEYAADAPAGLIAAREHERQAG